MNTDLITVLVLLGICMVCFIVNKPRIDIIAVIAIIVLPLIGLVDFKEALSGFADASIMLILLMFIMGEGLVRTGVSYNMGSWILKRSGNSQTRLMIFLMATIAIVGAVMSSTGIVAIFIPIVMSMCGRLRMSPSRFMMPLSFAGLISGMMSLVATPPNVIMSGALVSEGFEGLKFFDVTPIGITVLVAGIIYMLYVRRFLGDTAPIENSQDRKNFATYINDYKLSDKIHIFKVLKDSPFVGKELKDIRLPSQYRLNISCIERSARFEKNLINPKGSTVIQPDDLLMVYMIVSPNDMQAFLEEFNLTHMPLQGPYFKDFSREMGLAEIAISPNSELIGATLIDAKFRSEHGLSVVGMRHDATAVGGDITSARLKLGDILLVVGPWKSIQTLKTKIKNFIVFNLPAEFDSAVAAPGKAPFAVLSLAVMLVLMIGNFDFIPHPAMAAFIGCLLMVVFGCLDMDDAYKSINWPTVVLIIGMMPFAIALKKTGGVEIAANFILEALGDMGPRAVLAGLFLLTMLTGLFISNTVTAVLVAPVAISAAKMLEVSPYPFAIGVALAASTAFMTPISSPVNTLVWAPGRYKFTDFMKIGIPFSFIVMLICVILIPILFPFSV